MIVEEEGDQYSTDFMKCIHFVKKHFHTDFELLVVGGLGGRVDQSFHSLHHLYLSYQEDGQIVYLVTPDSISFLIPSSTFSPSSPSSSSLDMPKESDRPNLYTIKTPLRFLGKTCGLIPLGGTARITTKGLEWDVEDWETSFGSRISTSNHLLHETTEVATDSPILFTVELKHS